MNVDIPVLRHAPRSRSLGCAPYLVIALLLSGLAPATLRRLTMESLRTAYEANGRDPWTAFGIAKRYEEDGDAEKDGREPFDQKNPLPAGHVEPILCQ